MALRGIEREEGRSPEAGGAAPQRFRLPPAYRAGDTIIVPGQVGAGADGTLVPGGIEAEARQALDNLFDALKEAGGRREQIIKVTVWLADLADLRAFNSVYRLYFPTRPPARTTTRSRLLGGALVEMEAVAAVSTGGAEIHLTE